MMGLWAELILRAKSSMYLDDPYQKPMPLKGQLPLFTKGIDHLKVQPKFCLDHILNHFTFFGRAIEVQVVHIKNKDDIDCVREWIED
jgi:hypothetical protein